MSNRPNKPHAVQRARYVFGWMLALGAAPGRWEAECPLCDRPMTLAILAGVQGRPERYVSVAHTTPYGECGRYHWSVLAPMCDACNEALGEVAISRDRFPLATVAYDSRVDTPTARRLLGEARVAAREAATVAA